MEDTDARREPITVSLVNDYEVIVQGLQAMLTPYSDRVRIVELQVGDGPDDHADVALFDTFSGRRYALERAAECLDRGLVKHVVFYTWDASAEFLRDAERAGAAGVVLKTQSADELVSALERIVAGERVGLVEATPGRRQPPGDELSSREREVLALMALGLSNREIAAELYLSVDTVKTYVRRVFAKLGVNRRAQAAARAVDYDLQPPRTRLT
jgi:DNA-binding NarL/FixJ family response regulator